MSEIVVCLCGKEIPDNGIKYEKYYHENGLEFSSIKATCSCGESFGCATPRKTSHEELKMGLNGIILEKKAKRSAN